MINEDSIITENDNVSEDLIDATVNISKDMPKDKIIDYLSNDILDVKTFSDKELSKLNEKDNDMDMDNNLYSNNISDIQERQVVNGTVVGTNDKGVIIDIGFKSEGLIDKNEFSKLPDVGDEVDVFLISFENKRGQLILSKERADFVKRWDELRNAFKDETIINGKIVKRIKGGFVVDLLVVNAFLPGSQIDVKSVTDYDQYLGKDYDFKIVKFNEFRQNIVVSRKAILSGEMDEHRKKILENIEVGSVHEGIVKNITDFGAFIDLGGIDGLLHITDFTWGRINHPSEKLSVGSTVNVKVIDYDEKTSRISLGTKQLTEDPWKNADDKYEVGNIVKGKVVNLMNYGLFIEIEEGVEGLIHISEISWTKHIKHPSDMYKVGDKIEAKVLSINIADKKISLGIKQLNDNPWESIEDKFKVDDVVEGPIKNVVNNGAFISINDEIEGFLHNSNISWTRKVKSINDLYDKNSSIKCKIIEISSSDKKLILSHKDLVDDPWNNIDKMIKVGQDIQSEVIHILENNIICLINNQFEGLINITDSNRDQCKIIQLNDSIEVKIESIDTEKRKIILVHSDPNDADDGNKKSKKPTKKDDIAEE